MDKHLHIVTHEVPWPADYGGVYDLFHKIKALHEQGIKIHLHCFTGKRKEQAVLNDYCHVVHYYPRKRKRYSLSLRLPYIVSSRNHPDLLKNLQQDQYPVLLEGIHCTYLLYKGYLSGRKVFVRLHNVEWQYYMKIFRHEADVFKKAYFFIESMLLKCYEKKIAGKAVFLAVNQDDAAYYTNVFKARDARFLPVFIPWQPVPEKKGRGSFCLYHGNLEISENEKAAEWLLNHVFNSIDVPFVIAGKNPSLPLQTLAHSKPHTCIVMNPSEKEMQDMICKAQVQILPSFNKTGVKLKLLNALFNGRHCLVNETAIKGSGLEGLCTIAETPEEFQKAIARMFDIDFSAAQYAERMDKIGKLYCNDENARRLISWIY